MINKWIGVLAGLVLGCGLAFGQVPNAGGGLVPNVAAVPTLLLNEAGGTYVGPCDILAAAGTPCVAAHSVTRKMFANYAGNAFQLTRVSDSTTLNVGFTAAGIVNQSAWTSFCSGTVCYYSNIYDQAGNANNLPQATAANQAPLQVMTLANGQSAPVVNTGNATFYRNRASTSKIPTGTQSTTEYYVRNLSTYSQCCGDYGNMETTVVDTGNGHMFALEYSAALGTAISGSKVPLFGVDVENGAQTYPANVQQNCGTVGLLAKYSNALNATTIKLFSLVNGQQQLLANNAAPMYTPVLEGGLSLGEGGDGSEAPTSFFEGAIITGATTDATDTAINANISAFYGGGNPLSGYVGPGDICPGALAWYGMRAYNNTYAQNLGKLINIIRASDSVTCDILAAYTGGFGLTANCSNGATSNGGTITTFLTATTGKIVTWYDQSGNGYHVTQATGASQPSLTISCQNLQPCAVFAGAQFLLTSVTVPNYPQPIQWSAVAERTGNTSAIQAILSGYSSGNQCAVQFSSSPNNLSLFCGTTQTWGGTDNVWHSVQVGVFQAFAGQINTDGVVTTGLNAGNGALNGGSLGIGANPASGVRQFLTGNIAEAGVWAGFHNPLIQAAMNQNQAAYYLPTAVTFQTFTASANATYTPNVNLLYAVVECVGQGGGSGGAAASAAGGSSGGGGGSGSYSRVRLTAAQIGASQAVTNTAAANAGATGNNPGTVGNDTSLGTLCVAKGGSGGGGAAANSAGAGGAGGVGSSGTGDFKVSGNAGGGGFSAAITTADGASGYGAPGPWGGMAAGVNASASAVNGVAGGGCGAGASGGESEGSASTAAGAVGAAGCILITEYNSK